MGDPEIPIDPKDLGSISNPSDPSEKKPDPGDIGPEEGKKIAEELSQEVAAGRLAKDLQPVTPPDVLTEEQPGPTTSEETVVRPERINAEQGPTLGDLGDVQEGMSSAEIQNMIKAEAARMVQEQQMRLGEGAAGGYREPLKSGEIYIPVKTQNGLIAQLPWLKNSLAGYQRMKDVLGRYEVAKAENQGAVAAELGYIESIINAILDERNREEFEALDKKNREEFGAVPGYIETAKRMNAELNARMAVQKAFLQFRTSAAMDPKQARQIVEQLSTANLETIFRMEEVTDGMNYYEQNIEKYLELTGPDKDLFRRNAQAELVKIYGTAEDRAVIEQWWDILSEKDRLVVTKFANFPPALTSGDIADQEAFLKENFKGVTSQREDLNKLLGVLSKQAWSQTLAERVYRMLGRAMEQLELKQQTRDEVNKGKDLSFEGETPVGGEFGYRKLFRWTRFLKTQGKKAMPVARLMEGVDLEGGSFFVKILAKQAADQGYAGFMLGDRTRQEMEKVKDNEGNSDWDRLTNEERQLVEKLDRENKEELRLYGSRRVKLNFRAVDWRRFTFRTIADEQPLGYWGHRHIVKPEEARVAMFDKVDSFLRNPNKDTLYSLADPLDYLEGDQWDVKEKMAENFIDYARKERHPQTGKLRYTHQEIVAMANELMGKTDEKRAPFIRPERGKEFLKKVLKHERFYDKFFNDIRVKFAYNFIFGLILDWIKAVTQSFGLGK